MKFADFQDNTEMLLHFGLRVVAEEFINFATVPSIKIPTHLKEDLRFLLANRGDKDLEHYACEALIFPFLKEAWKRNPKAKLFSHPQIKYEDMILVPDYVVTPKDKVGLNKFTYPLLITVEAKNDDYALGWSDVYKQLVVAKLLNNNENISIYALVSIGEGWQIGKLEGKLIYKHPTPLSVNNPNQLLGVLNFMFADCVQTAEKFGLYA